MDKPDIATVIDSHFEEMTDLEQEIARYFLQAETITKITYLSGCTNSLC